MSAEVSQRVGYVFGLAADLPEDVANYILDEAENAENFDSLPLDVQLWVANAESQTAVHPGSRQSVLEQELAIDKELP